MAENFGELKITIRSLLTITKNQISIEQLEKDYYEQEGEKLPYRRFGYNTIFDLLNSMPDVVIVPPNPTRLSLLSVVLGNKTNHLRLLVLNQKTSKPKKSKKTSLLKQRTFCNNFKRYNSQNNINKYNGNKMFNGYNNNRNITSGSTIRTTCSPHINTQQNNRTYNNSVQINMNSGNIRLNGHTNNNNYKNNTYPSTSRTSYPQQFRNQQNGTHVNSHTIQNMKNNVNNRFHDDIPQSTSDTNNPQQSNELHNITSISPRSNNYKNNSSGNNFYFNQTMPIMKSGERVKSCFEDKHCNPSPTSSSSSSSIAKVKTDSIHSCFDLQSKLHFYLNKLISNSSTPITKEKLKCLIREHSVYCNVPEDIVDNEICNVKDFMDIKNMSININSSSSDADIIKQKSNQGLNKITIISTDLGRNTNNKNHKTIIPKAELTEAKSPINIKQVPSLENSFNDSSSCLNEQMTKRAHSTPKTNDHLKKLSNSTQQSDFEDVSYNLARIFSIYFDGVNIQNLRFIYNRIFGTLYNPKDYGFESDELMIKSLHNIIEIRNHVLYHKYITVSPTEFPDDSIRCEKVYNIMNIQIKEDTNFYLHKNISIKFVLEQEKLSLIQSSTVKMLLSEVYNPSLFFMQLACKAVEVDKLIENLQSFYNREGNKYKVEPKHVLPKRVFVSCYVSCSSIKCWYRAKVLREIEEHTVEVFQVDYGTVVCVPKTELRLLKDEFSYLPGQALQCCLTGYNELEVISSKVTETFAALTMNKTLLVDVDKNYSIMNNDFQILHVTLYHRISNSIIMNLNNKLTISNLSR
ncbi:probable cyclin-dependent serine/threonine-protein kinase DDB_G0292550 [Adelges cooleyi]|uniref:probable cyclin-dependent serine/threonine-protein kinase DDB_G0292550 n=1 Tax=Adelges cooleyi TaxID=133065 RepID=UPI0021805CD7|nr:probable cyclin-dependent serine/threonine-protein kinase DDB_G0292550 [Adelges cooleyi]